MTTGTTAPPSKAELERLLLQTQLETAQFELEQLKAAAAAEAKAAAEAAAKEAKSRAEAEAREQEAEDKAREKAREARRAAAVADLKGVTAGIDAIKGATLVLPEKTVFRESLVARSALEQAAAAAATTIQDAAGTHPVLLTSRTDQAEIALAAIAFRELIRQCHDAASKLLPPPVAGTGGEFETNAEGEDTTEAAPTPDSVFGAVLGIGVAALNALSVETTIDANSGTISELETHIAVTSRLLSDKDAHGKPKAHVLHDSIGLPSPDSALLTEFGQLQADLLALEGEAATRQSQIDRLDPKKPAQKAQIDVLAAEKAKLTALAERIAAVIEAANTMDAASGTTPLHTALRAHAAVSGDPRYIAVVPPARLHSHQITLKRRLFAPRLVVSASAEVDVVVLDANARRIVAAATHTGEAAFQVRFPMWWWRGDDALAPKYTALTGAVGV